ncbi:MAG TPA: hypothetical protein VE987_16980, partial [Polyangiaceae bacterium]|nr:hypothetical protein [Polyangiaceae bacterium]
MRDRWRRAFRSLLFGVMLAACGGQLAACGDQPPPSLGDTPQGPGGPGGAGCATPGSAGCPCAQAGQTAACGKIVDQSGSYVTCSMGTATCDGQAWGPCIGNRIVQKSVAGRSLASGSIRIESATSACSNVCDPNPSCTAIAGGPADVDAGGVAIANGGITLAGSDAAAGTGDGGQCSGNTCKIVACGGDGGTTTTIKGVVYDPAGVNPLYNATVYVPTSVSGKLPAFSSGASCDQCAGASIYAAALTTTATDGSFTLTNAPSGTNIPIVVQMGKWRRELLLSQVTACAANSVTGNCTAADPTMCTLRLPRNKYDGYNALDGQYDHADIPQMALVTGSADPLECMLLKAGIDPSEFSSYDVNPSARIHFYASPDAPGTTLDSHYGHNVAGDVLWLDPGDPTPSAPTSPHYDFYDVVLLPCEGASIDKEPL